MAIDYITSQLSQDSQLQDDTVVGQVPWGRLPGMGIYDGDIHRLPLQDEVDSVDRRPHAPPPPPPEYPGNNYSGDEPGSDNGWDPNVDLSIDHVVYKC